MITISLVFLMCLLYFAFFVRVSYVFFILVTLSTLLIGLCSQLLSHNSAHLARSRTKLAGRESTRIAGLRDVKRGKFLKWFGTVFELCRNMFGTMYVKKLIVVLILIMFEHVKP